MPHEEASNAAHVILPVWPCADVAWAIDMACRRQNRLALALVGLRDFRVLRDTHGQDTAERFVTCVAKTIKQAACAPMQIMRIREDELIILLDQPASVHCVVDVAYKMLNRLEMPVRVTGKAFFASASVGVSVHPEHGANGEDLLGKAQLALDTARSEGYNQLRVYTDSMNTVARHSFTLDQNMRRALTANQFSLAYQPIVACDGGRIAGVEALLRWKLADGSDVAPGEFIPLAERTGTVVPIGRWVLGEACRQSRAWSEASGQVLPIAVNVSSRELMVPGFADAVLAAVAQPGIAASAITLEITESAFMQTIDDVLPLLKRLTDAGIGLAIDDFGTGYSSLNYLRKLPVSVVKIDRSFIRDLRADGRALAVVRSIITLASDLGIRTTAEGIEYAEQFDLLRDLGCDHCQGYYFSRPLPAAAATELLKSRTAWAAAAPSPSIHPAASPEPTT